MCLLLDRPKHLLKKVRQIKAQILIFTELKKKKKKLPLVLEAICSLRLFMRYPLCFYIPGELIYEQYEGYGAKMARSQNIMSFDQFFFCITRIRCQDRYLPQIPN